MRLQANEAARGAHIDSTGRVRDLGDMSTNEDLAKTLADLTARISNPSGGVEGHSALAEAAAEMTRRLSARTNHAIYDEAAEAFGSPERGRQWLERPNAAFLQLAPVDLLKTPEGAEQVRVLLGRIAHGISA